MRTLLLLRHGKAVGDDPDGDHERSLNARGRQQATEVAVLLQRLGIAPDLALVSDARRTRETAELALAGTQAQTRIEPGLYGASSQDILDFARGAPDASSRVLIVGHNPAIGEVARLLEGSGEPQAAIALQDGFPTGALAIFEFEADFWRDVRAGSGLLIRFIAPDRSTVRD